MQTIRNFFMGKIHSKRPTWLLALVLLLTAAGVASAQGTPPAYLQEITLVPFNSDLYHIRYTTTCAPNDPACDCDEEIDDINGDGAIDGINDYDEINACLANRDSNGDGIFDAPQDANNNGVADIVDPDWTGGGDGILAESMAHKFMEALTTYDSWGLDAPDMTVDPVDQARDFWIYHVPEGYVGVYRPAEGRFDMGAEYVQRTSLDPRTTLAHEVWHAIQSTYGNNILSAGRWFIEGQAAMVPDRVWEALDSMPASGFVNRARNYIAYPIYPVQIDSDNDGVRDIVQPQGLLGFGYEGALWWAYLAEQVGTEYLNTPAEGMDFLVSVLKKDNFPFNLVGWSATDFTLWAKTGRGFEQMFWDFTIANYARTFDLSLLSPSALNGRDPQRVLRYRDEGPADQELDYGEVPREVISAANMPTGQNGVVAGVVPLVESSEGMPIYGVKYYEGVLPTPADCPVAYWRVDGAPASHFMHSFLLLEDRNGNGEREVTALARHWGEVFAQAIVNKPAYRTIAGIVTTGRETDSYAWQMGCEEVAISVVEPTVAFQAAVGAPGNLGRFLVWVEVKGLISGAPVTDFDALENFAVQVGGVDAQVLNGDVVQNRYWLVVQAPEIPGAAAFDAFDVRVELIGTGATDTSQDAVVYGVQPREQVLLVDRSGSMADQDKLIAAQTAAGLFIDTTRQDDQLGVVSFNQTAATEFAMTPVPDQDDAGGTRAAAALL
ncbi:MAG: VWA domain-containing protein [Caldilineaceae bacterium]